MGVNREKSITFAKENRGGFLDELKELLRIPSISTDPAFEKDIRRAAEWLRTKLDRIGMVNVQIMATKGHPVVYGENLNAGEDAPTMMVYGHYDVQPADPVELWESEAFEPEERNGNLYARGSSDMKGQVMASIFAIEAVMSQGALPYNIKFMIEGEEEHTSPNLEPFMKEHKDLLACDFILNPDAGMFAADIPTITYSLRGICSFEVHVQGPTQDLHSGMHGGAVRNPANELARLIGGMHDEEWKVTLKGFYDRVRIIDDEERAELSRLPIDEDAVLEEIGAPQFWGEPGYTYLEKVGTRPTLDVNGIISGYNGEGMKTVLPSKATAKITTRLVADQEPDEVYEGLKTYMEENADASVTWTIKYLQGNKASMSNMESDEIQAMSKALESVWGMRPVFNPGGGTIPAVGYMKDVLGAESVLTGFSRPDDNIHSPNEKLHLSTWYKGIDSLIHFLENLKEIYD